MVANSSSQDASTVELVQEIPSGSRGEFVLVGIAARHRFLVHSCTLRLMVATPGYSYVGLDIDSVGCVVCMLKYAALMHVCAVETM